MDEIMGLLSATGGRRQSEYTESKEGECDA